MLVDSDSNSTFLLPSVQSLVSNSSSEYVLFELQLFF